MNPGLFFQQTRDITMTAIKRGWLCIDFWEGVGGDWKLVGRS